MVSAEEMRSTYYSRSGNDLDEDLGMASINRGTFYGSVEELAEALASGDGVAKSVWKDLLSVERKLPGELPSDKKVAKDIAHCLMNTSLARHRVVPFKESNAVFSHREADDILGQYGETSGNPLAFLFDEPFKHYAVCTVRGKACVTSGSEKYRRNVALFLSAYDPLDRRLKIHIDWYSPMVWGLLENRRFTDEYVERLLPHVKKYYAALSRTRSVRRSESRLRG